ncbi:LacI family DNA-binding transcriptional regulator [Phaeobacter gallaeciensis]|uniref:LacI family DNA-binding transcriptional regulator n=1 Tax=Phaeobacter gallaeciensis TaxID=60890 RepID=UPI000BBBADD4|nr:LacI family DNA-binding transcriptional regulator [Phaeobacter gallaeciensis]ATF18549.1 Transcriptional regulator [Phaeobacter gallaeciensis]ATF22658.1 Transcriptional regulator [Phaeobacter gallaeciensis]
MGKPTLHDVAAAAGVSYATADRVLNNRGGVAKKSQDRVRAAIADLGYQRDITAANLSRRRQYRFAVLLPAASEGFFARLHADLEQEVAARSQSRQQIAITRVPPFDAAALTRAIESCAAEGYDGICLVAVEDPGVEAALTRLRAQGVAVVTLVADSASQARDAYVGIDNRSAGRTAGDLMRLAHRGGGAASLGQILPITGSLNARDHADRYAGFCDVVSADLHILPPLETGDDPEILEQALGRALRANPDITGIYNLGAGIPGLISALATTQPGDKPVVISHELCAATRDAVANGLIDAVIDQKPAQEITAALAALVALSDGQPIDPLAGQITPAVHFKHNMPPQSAVGPEEGA